MKNEEVFDEYLVLIGDSNEEILTNASGSSGKRLKLLETENKSVNLFLFFTGSKFASIPSSSHSQPSSCDRLRA
jgi:hypothetical protein